MPESDPLRTTSLINQPARSQETTPHHSITASGPEPTPGSSANVPGYEILGELGRGGMGIVYHARQTKLRREVALKMVLSGRAVGRSELIRFLAEAAAVAAVKHANVVQVYEYGESDGLPYMALEYLSGGTLAARLAASGPLAPDAATKLVEAIALGVGAAHAVGIIHRDLKPGNVLMTADDQPKVTDFGLAKRGETDLTQSGAVMGTPAHMAPEQADGKSKFVGPQADVWALGVVLCECLTGKRPFRAKQTNELLARIMTAEPEITRTERKPIPRDLELILRKCLEKNPADRYPTATELSDDLGRYSRGEPISVRAAGPVEKAVKWARRKPTAAAAVALGTLAFLAVAVGIISISQWRMTEGARQQTAAALATAEVERTNAEVARELVAGQKVAVESALGREQQAKGVAERLGEDLADAGATEVVNRAYRDWNEGHVDHARTRLDAVRPDLRTWEWRYVRRLCGDPLVQLKDPRHLYDTTRIRLHLSPDGSRLHYSRPTTGQGGGQLHIIWDTTTRTQFAVLLPSTGSITPTFTPAGGRLVFPLHGFTKERLPQKLLVLTDPFTGKYVCRFEDTPEIPLAESIPAIHFSADLSVACAVGKDNTIRVWDAVNGKQLHRLDGQFPANRPTQASHPVSFCARATISPDGTTVAVAHLYADKPIIRLWDVKSGSVRGSIPVELPPEVLQAKGHLKDTLQFSSDGTRLALELQDRFVRVYPSNGGPATSEVPLVGARLLALGSAWNRPSHVLAPGCDRVAFSDAEGIVRVVTLDAPRTAVSLAVPGGEVHSLRFSPEGQLITTGRDNNVRWWNPTTGQQLRSLHGLGGAVLSHDGRFAADIAGDTIRVWRATSPDKDILGIAPLAPLPQAVSPDGKLGARYVNGQIIVNELPHGKPLRTFPVPAIPVPAYSPHATRIRFHPGGKRLLYAYTELKSPVGVKPILQARILVEEDVATGVEVSRAVGPVSESPTVPTASMRYVTQQSSLDPKPTPDDHRALIKVVDAFTGRVALQLPIGAGSKFDFKPRKNRILGFSPDDAFVLTGDGHVASVWDLSTGRLRHTLAGTADADVLAVAYTPDGNRVLTTDARGVVRQWDSEGKLLTTMVVGNPGGAIHVLGGTRSFDLPGNTAGLLAFSPDGTRAFFLDQRLSIWDLHTGRERLNILLDGVKLPTTIRFSQGGNQIHVGRYILDAQYLPPAAETPKPNTPPVEVTDPTVIPFDFTGKWKSVHKSGRSTVFEVKGKEVIWEGKKLKWERDGNTIKIVIGEGVYEAAWVSNPTDTTLTGYSSDTLLEWIRIN